MPTNTYVALDKITLGSATNTVNFTSIPQTYTDLVLVIGSSLSTGGGNPRLQLNSNTGTNYSQTSLYGNGTSAASFRISNSNHVYFGGGSGTANTQSTTLIHLMNYSNTTTNKTVLIRYDDVTEAAYATVGMFRNTAAITSIQLTTQAGNFNSGSTFSLYGVAAFPANLPDTARATGGTITYTNTDVIHTFTSSGTFTPSVALTCDYLVVAGGGGGGTDNAGGGGAGGLRSTIFPTGGSGSPETPISLLATGYTVTIGAGGAGAAVDNRGTSGNNSVFGSITSSGGGGAGSGSGTGSYNSGNAGGSGGGARGNRTGAVGGTGTASQGFSAATPPSGFASTGGGGAGAPSAASVGGVVGTAGGAGVSLSISGSFVTYAGGGGASWNGNSAAGGAGGGGAGGTGVYGSGVAGTANRGGGGGGGGDAGGLGAAGGSGIVIIRYPKA